MTDLSSVFIEAGTLMVAGMLFVFTFLGFLVLFINTVLTKLAVKYPDPVIQSKAPRLASKKNKVSDGLSPRVVAAIGSAVSKYRQQHIKNK